MVHKTSTAHWQLPIQHTCNQVINDASPFPLTDQTNFLSPTTSATVNNGAIKQKCHPMTQASYVPSLQDVQLYSHTFNQLPQADALGN